MLKLTRLLTALAVSLTLVSAPAAASTTQQDRNGHHHPNHVSADKVRERVKDGEAVRIGSYNVKFSISESAAFNTVMRAFENVDAAALQEWVGRADLNDNFRKAGWGVFKPSGPGADTAVVWRQDQYKRVRTFSDQIIGARKVGSTPGEAIKSVAPARTVAGVVLENRTSGEQVTLISAHLPAHIETKGGPRPAATTARINHFLDATAGLASLAARHAATSPNVFVAGDYNVDYTADFKRQYPGFPVQKFSTAGFRSSWTKVPNPRGTHGGRLIDQVFSETLPMTVRTLPGSWVSDHNPFVATYELRAY